MRPPTALALVAVLLALAVGSACGSGEEAEGTGGGAAQAPPEEVRLGEVQHSAVPITVRLAGSLAPDERVVLAGEVAGRVVAIEVDLGDDVRPGELLLRIDPSDYQLAVDERRLALERALAGLGLGPEAGDDEAWREVDLENLPTMRRASLEVENARARYERARALGEARTQVLSEQALEDLRTTRDVAESALAVERLLVREALAEAATLDAQLGQARWRLERTELRAPSAPNDPERLWAVADRSVAVGDFVVPGQELLRLVDPDPVKLRAAAPERMAGTLRAGQGARVRLAASPDSFPGQVSRVAPNVDEATRTFQVEVLVPNPERLLKPGSFANADVLVGEERALLVPREALVRFAGVERVFLAQGSTARERRVRVLGEHGDLLAVEGDLEAGQRVLLEPSARVVDGVAIRPIGPVATPADETPRVP
jgi:membrane fusion protein, multidrug efflux system